jgi:hypothetical protein
MFLSSNPSSPVNSNHAKLFCRNQFILGPSYIEQLPGWNKVPINDHWLLTGHPDLNIQQVQNRSISITLVGYIIDSEDPFAQNEEILGRLVDKINNEDLLFEETYSYGGRWILVIDTDDRTLLFNDASGLRQVFYTNNRIPGSHWCASQPGMLADLLDLRISEEALHYVNSFQFRTNPEFRFPGYSSPYQEIEHLLPNHWLNLKTWKRGRYWPVKSLNPLSLDTAVKSIGKSLCNLMQGASARFDLALSLTAGLDSRIVMAASKEIINNIALMTVRQIDKPEDYVDVLIPSELLSRIGLKHEIVHSSYIIDKEYYNIFLNNTALPHWIYAPDAYAIIQFYNHGKVAATGSASEIGRSSFKKQLGKPNEAQITSRDLAKLQNMEPERFVLDAFDEWLMNIGDRYNIHTLDLFEWEQGHGNWLAMCQLEFDVAWQDIFTPYNCRSLLASMLSVEDKYRESPDYKLHMMLVSELWPELLDVPINPHPAEPKSMMDIIKGFIPYEVKKRVKKIVRRS